MKIKYTIIIVVLLGGVIILLLFQQRVRNSEQEPNNSQVINEQIAEVDSVAPLILPKIATAVRILDSLGLVNIHKTDSSIGVQLKYSTTDNFTRQVLYDDLIDAYLQPDVALMLGKAQQYLHSLYPELNLLVYDAARPLSIQQLMWNRVKDTPYHRYIANPGTAGLHNYGAAVDLTIADSTWTPLDMGTPFDFFGKAAGINNEDELVEQGILTIRQTENRKLLRDVMRHAGFHSISGEWWHFNACSLSEAKQRYRLIEHF